MGDDAASLACSTVPVMADRPGASKLQARTRAVLRPLASRAWNIERVGFDRLPHDGPAILCPNHISFLDSAVLMLSVPRNVSFVGKAEYMDDWKTKFLFPALGMIPIDRSGGSKSQAALDAAENVLKRGELFGIYPEGTRSRDGDLYKGRTGAARLAMTIGCPIFPVGISGTDEIQPIGSNVPRFGKSCRVEIGRAIRPERYAGRGAEHLAWRSMIDEVMFEVREMTGQTYHNVYSGERDDGGTTEVSKVGTVADEPAPVRERELVSAG